MYLHILRVHLYTHSPGLHATLSQLERLPNKFSWLHFKQGIAISPILWMANRGPVTHGMNIITDEILLLWKPCPLISYAIVFLSHPQIKELLMAPFNLYFTLCGKLRSLFGLGQFTLGAGGWKGTRQVCSSTTGLPKCP